MIPNRIAVAAAVLVFASAADADQPKLPQVLEAQLARLNLAGAVVSWCAVNVGAALSGVHAVAVANEKGSGEYLVVGMTQTPIALGSFEGSADLSCYSPQQARDLDSSIRDSEGIEGGIEPKGETTVVCGFVDATLAKCWQHQDSNNAFAEVGWWLT